MSYRVNEFVIESYTNDLGQTLEPGDDVVFVTTCMHRVSVETGKFEGVYRNLSSKKIARTRIGTVPVHYNERQFCEDGEHPDIVWDWTLRKSVPTGKRYNLVPRVKYRKSTLQLNRVFKIETPLAKVSI
jgi:hypothetical protein